MSPLLQRILRYTLYSAYFACCLILFGLLNLPYEEAENFLSRYARTHLNAELEIDSTSISPTGSLSIDRAALTFMPTVDEAKRIADAQRALKVWDAEQERLKVEKEEAKLAAANEAEEAKSEDNPSGDMNDDETDNETDDTDEEEKADADEPLKKAASNRRKKVAQTQLVKPIIPSPPLPIRFESVVASTSPIRFIEDLEDGQLFNNRNALTFESLINGSNVSLSVEREPNAAVLGMTIDGLELGMIAVLSRLTDFPISGSLSLSVELSIPASDNGYDFRETEGSISFLLQDEAKLGPATFKTKMGNVEFIPITFDKLELDLRVAKRRVTINEFRMVGKDLELCGTGYVSLNNGRSTPRPQRARRGKKGSTKTPAVQKLKRPQRSTMDVLGSMAQASRSNLFVRFKFKEQYLGKKENSLLRLLVNSRSMKKGMDAKGFIGHKTTATLKSLAGPLSWVSSKTSPHKSATNQCGDASTSRDKAKTKPSKARTKSKASKKRPKKPTSKTPGRAAKPFKSKAGAGGFNTTRTSSGNRKKRSGKSTRSTKRDTQEDTNDSDEDDLSDEGNEDGDGETEDDDSEPEPSSDNESGREADSEEQDEND